MAAIYCLGGSSTYRVRIPWSALGRRDMTAAGVSGSNYLVQTLVGTAVDALRPWSVMLSAGVTVLGNLRSNVAIPRIESDLVGEWLIEGAANTKSQPTLTSIGMSPKTWSGLVEFSHQFARQSEQQAETFIGQQLLRVAGRALDAAILGGSGNSGVPLGVANTPNIGSISGASLDFSDVLGMHATVGTAGAADANLSWIATPAVRQVLAARQTVTGGSNFLWQDNQIDGRPAFATVDAKASTLFLADWSKVYVGLWGSGSKLAINPYQDFSRGIIAARVLLDCDVAALQTSAICIATSVS